MANMSAEILRNIVSSVIGVKATNVKLSGQMSIDFVEGDCSTSGNLYTNNNTTLLGTGNVKFIRVVEFIWYPLLSTDDPNCIAEPIGIFDIRSESIYNSIFNKFFCYQNILHIYFINILISTYYRNIVWLNIKMLHLLWDSATLIQCKYAYFIVDDHFISLILYNTNNNRSDHYNQFKI